MHRHHHPGEVSNAAHVWNERERVFRVVGAKSWSLATFVDGLKAVRAEDVPRFEAITRAMLKAAQPFAHDCKLPGSKGTLLLSLQSLTPPRVVVRLCGQTYLDGKGRTTAKIQTV